MVSSGTITLCIDARILSEHEEVLARPRFAFDQDAVAALLDFVEFCGQAVASVPLSVRLPDPDDEPLLEVALAGAADHLVTGNVAHFPPEALGGASVLTPAELMERYRSGAHEGET